MGEAARKLDVALKTEVIQRLKTWTHPRLTRVGAVSFMDAMKANTGTTMGADEWAKGRARQNQLREQTNRLADLLEINGIRVRQPTEVQLLGEISGNIDAVESYRAVRFLPLVAQRDRRPVQAGLSFWLRTQKYIRYAVVTSGERLPLGGDLKARMKEHTGNIRRWSSEASAEYGVELLFRGTEFTVNPEGIHLHSNIVYKMRRVLSAERWEEFLTWSRQRLRAHWKDCGVLEDAAEVVKYCVKPAELEALDEGNLVWLFEQTYRAKLCQPLGSFAEWFKGLERDKLKVAMVRRGEKSRLCLVQKLAREPASGRGGEGENLILGRTLPQARWTQWAEPVSLVANYTRNPQTPEGIRRLAVLNQRSEQAAGWWTANKAPAFMVHTVRPTVQATNTQTMGDGTIVDFATGEILFDPPPRQEEERNQGLQMYERVKPEVDAKLLEWNAGAKDRSACAIRRANWENAVENEIKFRSLRATRLK